MESSASRFIKVNINCNEDDEVYLPICLHCLGGFENEDGNYKRKINGNFT